MTYKEFFSKYTYSRRDDKVMSGRFGSIYKAVSTRREGEVFLRVMQVDESSADVSLGQEVGFVAALPASPYIVRYRRSYRFEEATGEIDCAVMDYYPLGNLPKLLEDWKLDEDELRGLRDRILEAAAFLRGNGVNLPEFAPESVFVSEEDGCLVPHLIDISGVLDDNPHYERQVCEYLPVAELAGPSVESGPAELDGQRTESDERPVEEVSDTESLPERVPDDADSDSEPADDDEEEGGNSRKWKLLAGVALTWVAIFSLIGVLHAKRNAVEQEDQETRMADSVKHVVYPADEYAAREAARLDSIEKAKADSVAAYKADSAAYMKRVLADRAQKAKAEEEKRKAREEEEKKKEEADADIPESNSEPREAPPVEEPQLHEVETDE